MDQLVLLCDFYLVLCNLRALEVQLLQKRLDFLLLDIYEGLVLDFGSPEGDELLFLLVDQLLLLAVEGLQREDVLCGPGVLGFHVSV